MTQSSIASRKELEAQLIARAWQDGEFKQRLIADPNGTIAEATGRPIPPGVEIRVMEETPTTLYLVLPQNAAELSDEQLDAAAGGLLLLSGNLDLL